jgi:hypothetical protein
LPAGTSDWIHERADPRQSACENLRGIVSIGAPFPGPFGGRRSISAPASTWQHRVVADIAQIVRHPVDHFIGSEAVLDTLTADVLKTSEIEGERLDAVLVRSSLARRLGMDIGALKPVDRNVEGIVEMMLDVTRQYGQPLNAGRLFSWHASLFPTGRSAVCTKSGQGTGV